MVGLASGKRSCTAYASTWAAVWRSLCSSSERSEAIIIENGTTPGGRRPSYMVGTCGFEPQTSTVSMWRSPPELRAPKKALYYGPSMGASTLVCHPERRRTKCAVVEGQRPSSGSRRDFGATPPRFAAVSTLQFDEPRQNGPRRRCRRHGKQRATLRLRLFMDSEKCR